MRRLLALLVAAGLVGVLAAAGAVLSKRVETREKVIAAYTTSLAHRSPGQVLNALEAARALNGSVVPSGGEFSFNGRIGPWSAEKGYRRAPVSYDGELTLAVGGGVCQLSSTLYGALLLGGMDILERHRHFWPVAYAETGLDAAVAFPSIDLRFRNPLPAPVKIVARSSGTRLIVELLSTAQADRCSLERRRLASHAPMELVRYDDRLAPGELLRVNQGQAGEEVAVYRLHHHAGETERELISLDSYPTLNRIIKLGRIQ